MIIKLKPTISETNKNLISKLGLKINLNGILDLNNKIIKITSNNNLLILDLTRLDVALFLNSNEFIVLSN